MPKLESSNLAYVSYDAELKTLLVKFYNLSVYIYLEVPQETYDALLAADSHGKFFNKEIRANFAYARVK